MTTLEAKLMDQATAIHDRIFPCSSRNGFEHCFTRDEGKVCFWYNTEDQSTHLLVADELDMIEQMMPN
ncbi:MAG TPA: hypothetical protein VKF42_09955 [Chitinivibrionales bacterium]|jgi:hypothetical protein|nr:hypothetical protein [Chitinivibrionales bacterium]